MGDVYVEFAGYRSNNLPINARACILSLDKGQSTMEISLENKTKTIRMRDLIVLDGPRIEAAKADPKRVAIRGGRSVWIGGEGVRV